ncbi:hypothetical protein QVD17_16147 [Tagetes erecta]|uniref:F-box protein GID2 n=1 Tax=Tagetes erecta TaxID=13708 RepID=A0AAD8KUL0_TARER|nr:hypothetical protein QVD17_16147 [Tagetes erecta]
MVKRSQPCSSSSDDFELFKHQKMMKKIKPSEHHQHVDVEHVGDVLMDENLLFEVLKHVDARTLGAAACVNKRWNKTSKDERLWEMICTKHWANLGCGSDQLRIVVLALGGFRCLHSHYLLPLSKKPSVSITKPTASSTTVAAATTSSSVWPCLPLPPPTRTITRSKPSLKTRWGKDEIQLSLSLLSVHYFGKMSYNIHLSK